jgi:plastocyanin
MTTDDNQPTDGDAAAQQEPLPADESIATPAVPVSNAHPYRERWLIPFLFPLAIVVGVIFYALNISRIFLANKGSAAVIIAAVVTVAILFGATALSSAPRMKTSSIGLITVAALVVILGGGWLNIGHSEEKKEAAIELGAPVGEITIHALPSLKFDPPKAQVAFDPDNPTQTVISVTLQDAAAGQHTLAWDDATVIWNTIPEVNAAGEKKTEKAGFPAEGDYGFHCTIPGHKEAGMVGTLTVTKSVAPKKVADTTETSAAG